MRPCQEIIWDYALKHSRHAPRPRAGAPEARPQQSPVCAPPRRSLSSPSRRGNAARISFYQAETLTLELLAQIPLQRFAAAAGNTPGRRVSRIRQAASSSGQRISRIRQAASSPGQRVSRIRQAASSPGRRRSRVEGDVPPAIPGDDRRRRHVPPAVPGDDRRRARSAGAAGCQVIAGARRAPGRRGREAGEGPADAGPFVVRSSGDLGGDETGLHLRLDLHCRSPFPVFLPRRVSSRTSLLSSRFGCLAPLIPTAGACLENGGRMFRERGTGHSTARMRATRSPHTPPTSS